MNTKQYFLNIFLFIFALSCGGAPTAKQLQELDPETRRWVLEQQQKVEDNREDRIKSEKESLELQKEVFNWPLDRKIQTLIDDGPYADGVDELLVRKMLRAELSRKYSVKWQGNANGLDVLRAKMERLSPYIRDLAQTDNPGDIFYAIEFRKYTKIGESSSGFFYEVLNKSADEPSNVSAVLDVIFGYNFDTPELRSEIIRGLSTDPETSSSARYGDIGILRAGKWGLEGASSNLMDLLELHYSQTGNVRHGSLTSIKELGESASSVHERLKQLYDKVKEDGSASFREIEALEHALSTTSPRAESSKAHPFSSKSIKDDLDTATFSSSGSLGEGLDSNSAEEATSNETNNQKPLLWLLITAIAAFIFIAVWMTKRPR